MWNWLGHLRTIHHHKMLVMRGCFALGLYRQGLFHDLSKYSPTEFLVGAKYYTGSHSPNDGERRDRGYSLSWLHHKGISITLSTGSTMLSTSIPARVWSE